MKNPDITHDDFILWALNLIADFFNQKTQKVEWIEHYKNAVNKHSMKIEGGLQYIKTLDGYLRPIDALMGCHMLP